MIRLSEGLDGFFDLCRVVLQHDDVRDWLWQLWTICDVLLLIELDRFFNLWVLCLLIYRDLLVFFRNLWFGFFGVKRLQQHLLDLFADLSFHLDKVKLTQLLDLTLELVELLCDEGFDRDVCLRFARDTA